MVSLSGVRRLALRVIENPWVLIGRLKGLHSNHCLYCLMARDLVKSDFKTIIDVGSHEGVFIRAAQWVYPSARVYAFDPIPENFNRVRGMAGVKAFNFGLWDSAGEDTIYFNRDNTGASSFLKPTVEYNEDIGEENLMVERKASRKRFDSLNLSIERPCYLKIDVEGAEEMVLRGFGDRLKDVDVLQIEWFLRDFHEGQKLLPYLEAQGFVGFVQKELNFVGGKPGTCDLIFFREKK
jgi:FkbM family methyltransferase